MQSDMIGKIEKARYYAQEPERIKLQEFKVTFHGSNGDHLVTFKDGQWSCTCSFFHHHGTCAHVMAIQKVFEQSLSQQALQPQFVSNIPSDTVAV